MVRLTSDSILARTITRIPCESKQPHHARSEHDFPTLPILLHPHYSFMDRIERTLEVPFHAVPVLVRAHVGEEGRDASSRAGEDVVRRTGVERLASGVESSGGCYAGGEVAGEGLEDLSGGDAMFLSSLHQRPCELEMRLGQTSRAARARASLASLRETMVT
jgi:hypothetical protein